jgi:hypothetical protein
VEVGPLRLEVSPAEIACAAGDQVAVTATTEGGVRAAVDFTVLGDGAWITSVQRDRGTATLACEAAGQGALLVEAAGARAVVPIAVQPPPLGTLAVSVSPAAVSLINGTSTTLDARVTSTLAGVSTEARFSSSDTSVVVVDSVFGVVRSVAPGTATVFAAARADRRVQAQATVTVTRGSSLANGINVSPPAMVLLVADSARITASVQLTRDAPPGTSREVIFTSSDPSVAVVSAKGWVRGLAQGNASIFVAPVVAPLLRGRVAVAVRVPMP